MDVLGHDDDRKVKEEGYRIVSNRIHVFVSELEVGGSVDMVETLLHAFAHGPIGDFIDYDKEGFLSGVEEKRNVASEDNTEDSQ